MGRPGTTAARTLASLLLPLILSSGFVLGDPGWATESSGGGAGPREEVVEAVAGSNVSLACNAGSGGNGEDDVAWILGRTRSGGDVGGQVDVGRRHETNDEARRYSLAGSSLVIADLDPDRDQGVYTCVRIENEDEVGGSPGLDPANCTSTDDDDCPEEKHFRSVQPVTAAMDQSGWTDSAAPAGTVLRRVRLAVKSVPPAVADLGVVPHSVFALVTWTVSGDGGYPLDRFVLSYRLEDRRPRHDFLPGSFVSLPSDLANTSSSSSGGGGDSAVIDPGEQDDGDEAYRWRMIDGIPPTSTSKTVYNLRPNSTYSFTICAVNRLGPGPNVSIEVATTYSQDEIDQAKEELLLSDHGDDDELEDPATAFYIKVVVVAVTVVLVTFATIGLGISLLLMKSWCGANGRLHHHHHHHLHRHRHHSDLMFKATEEESMELVPHITLNPSFNIDMLEYIEPEESSSSSSSSLVIACDRFQQQKPPQAIQPPPPISGATIKNATAAKAAKAAAKAVTAAAKASPSTSRRGTNGSIKEDRVVLVQEDGPSLDFCPQAKLPPKR